MRLPLPTAVRSTFTIENAFSNGIWGLVYLGVYAGVSALVPVMLHAIRLVSWPWLIVLGFGMFCLLSAGTLAWWAHHKAPGDAPAVLGVAPSSREALTAYLEQEASQAVQLRSALAEHPDARGLVDDWSGPITRRIATYDPALAVTFDDDAGQRYGSLQGKEALDRRIQQLYVVLSHLKKSAPNVSEVDPPTENPVLATSDPDGELFVEITEQKWDSLFLEAFILEIQVAITNQTDHPKKTILSKMFFGGRSGDVVYPEMEARREARQRLEGRRSLADQLVIEPRETISGWMVYALPWSAAPGATPYALSIVDELNYHYTVKMGDFPEPLSDPETEERSHD